MYIGIDNGGTSTRIGLFKSLVSQEYTSLGRFPTRQEYSAQIDAITRTLLDNHITKCSGIGVSIGAQVARDGRSVEGSVNLRDYVRKPFADDLSKHFSCPVRLAHDAVCGLLAEKKFGHIQTHERCAYLTVSTGTGAAIQLRKGDNALTFSIEMGHQIIGGNKLACLCGQVGCLETITGGKQIELRFGRPADQISDPAFWEQFAEALALGLVNLAQLTRIDAVAISGGIALNSPYVRQNLKHKVDEIIRGASLSLTWAALGENAPLVGAALLLEIPDSTILH